MNEEQHWSVRFLLGTINIELVFAAVLLCSFPVHDVLAGLHILTDRCGRRANIRRSGRGRRSKIKNCRKRRKRTRIVADAAITASFTSSVVSSTWSVDSEVNDVEPGIGFTWILMAG